MPYINAVIISCLAILTSTAEAKKGSFKFSSPPPQQMQKPSSEPPEDYSGIPCPQLQQEVQALEKEEKRILGDPQILAIRRQMTAGGIESLQRELHLKRRVYSAKSCDATPKSLNAKKAGRAVITGTFSWEFGSDGPSFSTGTTEDIFYSMGKKTRALIPRGQAQMYLMAPPSSGDWRKVAVNQSLFSAQPIATEALNLNTMIVIKTNQGRFGVLRILKFYDSNDLAFEGTTKLPESTRQHLSRRNSIPKYHIQVEWTYL